jgi:hypothetical protein
MADNYDQNFSSSSTYGNDDMDGGGEQIDSALYLNETVERALEERLEKKQESIVLQPFFPPDNPKKDDMWIDNNVFPNIIYMFDGTQWIKVNATSASEFGAYTTAQVDTMVGETKLYASDKIKEAMENANLDQYMTESDFVIQKDAIYQLFAKGNGVNLLKNSVGYGVNDDGTFLNWQITAGTVTVVEGSDMIEANAGFYIKDGVIKQVVKGTVGEEYTLSVKVNKGTAGTAYIKLSDGTTFQQVNFIATQAYSYQLAQIKGFIPQSGTVIVELGATGATGGVIFTAAMLNKGAIGLEWSFANGEMYNSYTKSDINGLEVRSSVYDGYTRMSPKEFAGYARNNQGVMEKVFTLNKDTTEMKQAQLDEFVVIGGVKILRVDGGGKKGIAFIPNS